MAFSLASICFEWLARVPRLLWLASSCAVVFCAASRPLSLDDCLRMVVASIAGHVAITSTVAAVNGACAWDLLRYFRGRQSVRDEASSRSGAALADVGEAALVAGAAVILVCGGEPCRDERGASLAMCSEDSFVFFSSGHYKLMSDFDPKDAANPDKDKFTRIDFERLVPRMALDLDAIDTLANFTVFLRHPQVHAALRRGRSRGSPVDVVVVTSPYHVRRVRSVAVVVLGSRGLTFVVAEAVPLLGALGAGEREVIARRAPLETRRRLMRDILRAVLWVWTGFEGDAVAALFHRHRSAFRTWHRAQQRARGSEEKVRGDDRRD